MHVKQINFDDDGMPESITVRLTHDEAVYLAKLAGEQNHQSSEEVLSGGSLINAEVYGSLAGEVFNRYYEDGVDGAARAVRSK